MKRIPAGGTLTYKFQVKDPVTGSFLNLDSMSFVVSTRVSSDVTPVAPTMTRIDATTRHVRIPTTGLGGHSCSTLVTATDPLSGDAYPGEVLFTVTP